jgi:16S rRNA (adenine1518-N6/adenine1519-N6)-dimethyltransferase
MTDINLATMAGVKEITARYGLQAKKKLGQHFLVDGHVLGKIVAAANIGADDLVLEVGPGIGGMTQVLAREAGHVLAVELDKQLVPVLRGMFEGGNVTVVQGDILRLDLAELLAANAFGQNIKVVANLPYYITTPVIFHLLESGIGFDSITVMIQKEVAQRMSAKPNNKNYGSLTLAVQYHADVELVANVPTNCFMPRPAVDSAVVKLQLLPAPRVDTDKEKLFKVIHAAFGKRRKTLLNALDSEGFGGGKAALAEILTGCGIDPQTRGETLDIFQFAKLADVL